MKVVRVIKIIAFVVAVITLLVSAAGNFFIVKDAVQYRDQGVDVAYVKECLNNCEFQWSSLKSPFTASAEEEGTELAPEGTKEPDAEPVAEPAPAEDEVTSQEDNDAFFADVIEDEVINEPAEETAYTVDSHCSAVLGLMKLANIDWTDKKATELFEKADLGIFGGNNPDFTVNAFLTISFGCIVLAFILHLISKNVRKTFWGIMLMILGFIIFVFNFVLGNVLGNSVSLADASLESNDLALVRIFIIAFFTFIAVLFGLPYVRCGSRQMKIKELKTRIKKLRAKKKAD